MTRGDADLDGAAPLFTMKSKRKPNSVAETELNLTFEQAIEQLEKIVSDMEQAELPLEDVLKKYEEGTVLVRFCSHKLDEAEQKIELLTKQPGGSVALKPFAATAVDTAAGATEKPDDDEDDDDTSDDGRLF